MDNKFKGPKTPKTLMKDAQKIAQAIRKRYPDRKEDSANREVARRIQLEPQFGVLFDGLYRPYVYKYLLKSGFIDAAKGKYECIDKTRKHGFDYPELVWPGTTIEGENVYQAFRKKFFEDILLNFSFDAPRVGQGAFRNYIKVTVGRIVYDMLDLVPLRDENGNVVFSSALQKDKSGHVKLDARGKPLHKPVLVPCCFANQDVIDRKTGECFARDEETSEDWSEEFSSDQINLDNRTEKGGDDLEAQVETDKDSLSNFQQSLDALNENLPSGYFDLAEPLVPKWKHSITWYVLELAKPAYLDTIEERKKHEKAPWRSETIEAIFGRFENKQKVRQKLQDEGIIKKRTNFDNIKSLFFTEWYAAWWQLWRQIATGPDVRLVRGRLVVSKKRYDWKSLFDDEDQVRAFVEAKHKECKAKYGSRRLKELESHYDEMKMKLAEEAESAAAEKMEKEWKRNS